MAAHSISAWSEQGMMPRVRRSLSTDQQVMAATLQSLNELDIEIAIDATAFRRRSPSFENVIPSKVKPCQCWAGCDATAHSGSSWSCQTELGDSCRPPGRTWSQVQVHQRSRARPLGRSLIC